MPKKIADSPEPEQQTMELAAMGSVDLDSVVVLQQLPVITERLALLSDEIRRVTKEALSLTVTEETVTDVAKKRAELNRIYKEFEAKRKTIKTAILAPYEQFEDAYKESVGNLFADADNQLKTKIDAVRDALRRQKEAELRVYYDEYAASVGITFAPFERNWPSVTLSASVTAIKKEIRDYLDKMSAEVGAITGMDDAEELLAEYKLCLSLPKAIAAVRDRREREARAAEEMSELETRRRQDIETRERAIEAAREYRDAAREYRDAALPPPTAAPDVAPNDPIKTVTFKVKGRLSELRELKAWILAHGLEIIS